MFWQTPVVITGRCFSAVREVEFGSDPATDIKVVSSTQITAESPPGNGTEYVTVVTAAGASAPNAPGQFTYNAPPY
jgi:hypothetical protein